MATCRPIKTARRDLISSELPEKVKDRILEYLPTRDAARTAVLSTQWNDVWLQHGRLVFDWDFFRCVENAAGDKQVDFVKVITYILLQRIGPVKKFILFITPDLLLEQSDLHQWALYLSRNGVEELNLSVYAQENKYKLPSCIVSCPTIKKLILRGFNFDCRINAPCIFPGVTSLVLKDVEFNDNVDGIVFCIPNLEKLVLDSSEGFKGNSNFEISAPNLESLSVLGFMSGVVGSRWFALHLEAIKILCLSGHLLSACSLEDIQAASRLLEDPNSCIINKDLKMLNIVKIEWFTGSTVEMLFVQMLLSKSPSLERFVIQEYFDMDASMAFKIVRALLRLRRESTNAIIVWKDWMPTYSLVGYPDY